MLMERDEFARSVISAAERGDRLAFAAAAQRYGNLEDAQQLVRQKATLRMVDRVLPPVEASQNDTHRRSVLPAAELRADTEETGEAGEAGEAGVLNGYFTVWDTWYEVDSWFEGNFMERTVKGSTRKTIRENRDNMRVLLNHGMDPVAGDKPLGPIDVLREDDTGPWYEVPLLRDNTGEYPPYIRDVVPGLRAGLYGSSHRFRVMREEFVDDVEPSDHNPKGLPERTLKEIQVAEFGPVTFPANQAATATVRSRPQAEHAPPAADAASNGTSTKGRRVTFRPITREEFLTWK